MSAGGYLLYVSTSKLIITLNKRSLILLMNVLDNLFFLFHANKM